VEAYVQEHTDATFTHGICPTCAAKLRKEHGLDDREAAAGPRADDDRIGRATPSPNPSTIRALERRI